MTIQDAFQLHQAKRFSEAEALYRALLAASPADATARHFLGLVLHHQGRSAEGLPFLEESIRESPQSALFRVNVGAVYRVLKDFDRAEHSYKTALELDPGLSAVHHNLGNLHRDMSQWAQAEADYREALRLQPNYLDAKVHLAAAISDQGRHPEALVILDEALAEHPRAASVYRQRAIVLGRSFRHEESEQAAKLAVELDPNDVEAWNSLGIVKMMSGRFDEAKAAYLEAIRRAPAYVDAYTNLGLMQVDLRQANQAIVTLNMALQLNPRLAVVHGGLASAYHQASRLTEAIEAGKRAVDLNPQVMGSYFALAGAYLDRADLRQAAHWYERAWAIDSSLDSRADGVLLCLHYDDRLVPKKIAEAHFEWGRRVTAKIPPNPPPKDPAAGVTRRLRIGYVSPDFRDHSVAYFALPLLANHDREKFEIHAFSNLAGGDEVTEKFKKLVDVWHDVKSLSDEQLDAAIRAAGIDIVIDLAGHTGGSRTIALLKKPAPLMAGYLGYPDTSGSSSFDLRITDRWADPMGMTESLHCEKLARMNRVGWCFEPSPVAPPVEKPSHGKQIVFASFNNYSKTSDSTVRLWTKVLQRVPGSVLKLKSKCFKDQDTCEIVRRRFKKAGLTPERLTLLQPEPKTADHLAAYNTVDIALDPFPYNGTTTTCEALWMGVPVIALAGPTHVSRVGMSLLTSLGLENLIANDEKSYVEIAAHLASDPLRRTFFREELRSILISSALMDGAGLTREIESIYVDAWQGL